MKPAYFIKIIYQEGSSYLTHLKIALLLTFTEVLAVYSSVSAQQLKRMAKERAISLLQLWYEELILRSKRHQRKCKAENGTNTTTQLYSKAMWQKPVQKQNTPPPAAP